MSRPTAPSPRLSRWANFWAGVRRRVLSDRLELDEESHDDLARVLASLGATVEEVDWQMAGGTERSRFKVTWGSKKAHLRVDSGEGPRLIGDPPLLDAIRDRLATRRGSEAP